jgi:hypothetical protein
VPFHAGQTYLFPLNDDTRREHLWIIATEPDADGQFATASFTSLKGAKDQTVTFLKDEHPFIKWDTCILYSLAEITTTKTLQAYLDNGSAKMHQNASAAVLRLILDGFDASDFTKNRVRQFIREYKRATRDPGAAK